jgi:drug/metabolite transporter (DMT)-like permease
MRASQHSAYVFALLAALLWSPQFYAVEPAVSGGAPLMVVQFHLVFWPALVLLALVFVSGSAEGLSVFSRRETHFLVLAATGGYGFWILRSLALESATQEQARLLFYAAPLLMGLLSLLTREAADRRVAFGLVLGFVGCIMIFQGQKAPGAAGASGSLGGSLLAVAAAGCWALFSVAARPIVRQERALPVAALVAGIGAVCQLITCLTTGVSPLSISVPQMRTAALTGVFCVGGTLLLWLRCLGGMPAVLAAPFWYLGALFGVLWALRAGWSVSGWWALGGGVLILMGLQNALAGRRQSGLTLADVIRNR